MALSNKLLISLSALLTLTTKPTDLNSGIEGIFSPFKFMKSQISIFAMMISIALRSIPTLITEAQRILKAHQRLNIRVVVRLSLFFALYYLYQFSYIQVTYSSSQKDLFAFLFLTSL